jgi:hypothetical protein
MVSSKSNISMLSVFLCLLVPCQTEDCSTKSIELTFLFDGCLKPTPQASWEYVTSFVNDVLDYFVVSQSNVRVGLMWYFTTEATYNELTQFGSKAEVMATLAASGAKFSQLNTSNLAGGLGHMRDAVFDSGITRTNATKVAIVIVSYLPAVTQTLVQSIARTRSRGIRLIGIGVNDRGQVNKDALNLLSVNDAQSTFVSDYSQLDNYVRQMAQYICVNGSFSAKPVTSACISTPCLNGGSCIDGVNSHSCLCLPGFTGDNCQTNINECSSYPCHNGICFDHVNGYTCLCDDGYTGVNCQTEICATIKNSCLNGGQIYCEYGLISYNCICPTGFTGSMCETNVDECMDVPVPCLNGGRCIDGVNSYSCSCLPGFTGDICDIHIDPCSSSPCHIGVCLQYYGGYKCVCYGGYGGEHCDIPTDPCAHLVNTCLNGGTLHCFDSPNDYFCICPDGYTSRNCGK